MVNFNGVISTEVLPCNIRFLLMPNLLVPDLHRPRLAWQHI